jgi:hypothetical protein
MLFTSIPGFPVELIEQLVLLRQRRLSDLTGLGLRVAWLNLFENKLFVPLVMFMKANRLRFLDCDPASEDLVTDHLHLLPNLSDAAAQALREAHTCSVLLIRHLHQRDLQRIMTPKLVDEVVTCFRQKGIEIQP